MTGAAGSLRRVVGLTLVALLTLAPTAGANTPARALGLPTGGVGANGGVFNLIDCPRAGNCVAAGALTTASGVVRPAAAVETAGAWGPARWLGLPADPAANPDVSLLGLACATTSNCVATGSYTDHRGNVQALLEQSSGATWSATRVALPPDALATGQNATLRDVVCPRAGQCSAIGTYLDRTTPVARLRTFTLNERAGVWGETTTLPTPSDANLNPLAGAAQLACASVGNCVTVGSYAVVGGATTAFVASQVNGAWRAATALALPANASAYPAASLSEVTCAASAACTAVGTYLDTSGATQPMSATAQGGTWSRAVELALPSNAAVNPRALFYGFGGVACAGAGSCVTGGQYVASDGTHQGFLVNEVGGVWQRATSLALPAGATQAGANGGVVSLACASSQHCVAGAAYLDAAGRYRAGVVDDDAGVWSTLVDVALPDRATTVGLGGGVYAVVCAAGAACQGVGTYEDGAGRYPVFTVAVP